MKYDQTTKESKFLKLFRLTRKFQFHVDLKNTTAKYAYDIIFGSIS